MRKQVIICFLSLFCAIFIYNSVSALEGSSASFEPQYTSCDSFCVRSDQIVILNQGPIPQTQEASSLMLRMTAASPQNDRVIRKVIIEEILAATKGTPVINLSYIPTLPIDELLLSEEMYQHHGSEVHLSEVAAQEAMGNLNNDELNNELIVSLKVNHEESDILSTLRTDALGNILILLEDLKLFKVKDEYLAIGKIELDKVEYVNLKSLPGIIYNLDTGSLFLDITFPTDAMVGQHLTVGPIMDMEGAVTKPATGVFMNYDITFSKTKDTNYVIGLPTLNYFSEAGTLTTSSIIKRGLAEDYFSGKIASKDNTAVRLETYWISDNVDKMARWCIGDSFTQAADWSGSTRFAGLQYATNFDVRPNLITSPLLAFANKVDLPSTLDIFANANKIYSGELKPGAFDILNLPITGNGELTVKTQDITGKVTTIIIPYYVVPTLLTPGLSDFSFSAGTQRQFFSTESNRYKNFLTNSDYMHGINDYWTSGIHLESMQNFASVGITNTIQLKKYGLLSFSIATNISDLTDHQKGVINYNYQYKNFNFGISASKNGKDFYNTFTPGIKQSPKPSTQLSAGYGNEKLGNFSISLLSFSTIDSTDNSTQATKLLSGNYTKNLTKNSSGMLSLGTDLNDRKKSFFISFSYNLGIANLG